MSKTDKSVKKEAELKFSASIMQTTEAMSVKQPSRKLKKAVKKASKKLTKAVIKDLKKSASLSKKAEKAEKKAAKKKDKGAAVSATSNGVPAKG
ncbi:MAG: hypothetical protein JST46_11315 [Bacteroidetes bacterium]|nr:hypothetical protein [Bacteroidota bacterium]